MVGGINVDFVKVTSAVGFMGADATMETVTLQESDKGKGAGEPEARFMGADALMETITLQQSEQGAGVPVTNVQVAIEPSSGADITNIVKESDWWDTMLGVDGVDLTLLPGADLVVASQIGVEEEGTPASVQPGTPLHGFLVQVQRY